jgi:hypothetical protein
LKETSTSFNCYVFHLKGSWVRLVMCVCRSESSGTGGWPGLDPDTVQSERKNNNFVLWVKGLKGKNIKF